MAGLEWNILAGAITAAFGSGVAWAAMKVGHGTRIDSLEKFRDTHDDKDRAFRARCHDEVLVEIRELRRLQVEQFDRLNVRLDDVAGFRLRQGNHADERN